ncbi:hypothetical protein BKA63DRAFT_499053 [Paraphoma chrysanthemicola]|nr:hypothetical protein BKA63DRAFT_499053 [Paraphoma chrysanthemicola]
MLSQTETTDIGMGDGSSAFNTAIQCIERTLLEEHRQAFHHIDSSLLLEQLRNVAAREHASERTLIACSRKCALFVQTFAPYFNVLNICTQARPEWSGCFWGLVHLVIQVASDYPLFMEKVANLIEAIANMLPPYHQIYATCRNRTSSAQTITKDVHLEALMSYAYYDLVDLFLDIYCIFFRGTLGTQSRHLAVASAAPVHWRPLDSRFARLEGRLIQHRRWLEKETESHVQDFAEVEHHRRKYLRYLHRQADVHATDAPDAVLEEHRLLKRLRRVGIIQAWLLDVSHSEQVCSNVCQIDQLGSCNWFLQAPKYQRWKKETFDPRRANDKDALKSDWHDRVLFVQAEAGFGKSIVGRAVVDDLEAEAANLENSDKLLSVAYFCCSKHSDSTQSDGIFRQLAHQLLHANRHDHTMLDTVCLLLRKTSFSETASTDQVLEVLSVLLRQHPTFLVIDGAERCSDLKSFLTSLASLARHSDLKAIIFSRPSIKIPLEYQKWASDAPHTLLLDNEHNRNAIDTFVTQNLSQLADQGYFGIRMDRGLISQVARQSNGSFLWANTLLDYLHSPALTPDDRQVILENVQSLRSLEALYSHILRTLAQRPAREKRIIAGSFHWLSYPIHRLCASSLRTALASAADMDEDEDSFPTDLLQALPQLTCGLVEVTENSVNFAHPLVQAFLQSASSHGSEFSLCDENSVHAYLAARCLSYLAHDIPKRPLGGLSPHIRPTTSVIPTSSSASYRTSKSGDSGYKSLSSSEGDNALPHAAMASHHTNASTTSIRTIPFDTNLPFLRYASLCWPIHLSRALAPAHSHPYVIPTPGPFSSVPYLPALSSFLRSRLAVTAWVEASFRYSLPPTLTRLVGPLSDLKGEIPPATIEGKELRLVVNELQVLSERLGELKREFATSLRENPSLIWQMGGTVGEDFWPIWEGCMGTAR